LQLTTSIDRRAAPTCFKQDILILVSNSFSSNHSFSGFIHAAFTLGYEAGIHKCGIDGNAVPPGALITIVQKGLQYIELEASSDEVSLFIFQFLLLLPIDVTPSPLFQNYDEVERDFALLEPLEIITKDVEELQQIVKRRKIERSQTELEKDKGKEKERNEEHERRPCGEREREQHEKEKEQVRDKDKSEKDRDHDKEKEKERERQHAERTDKVKHEDDSLVGAGD
jgi:transducin (beta)-like 1